MKSVEELAKEYHSWSTRALMKKHGRTKVFKASNLSDAYVVEINGAAFDMDSRPTDPNGVCMFAGEMDDIIRAYVAEKCRKIPLTKAPKKVLVKIIEIINRELQ